MFRPSPSSPPPAAKSVRSTSSSIRVPVINSTAENARKGGIPLAQRLLSPNPSTLLPSLFPTSTPELELLNEGVYNFLALALRAFVLPWWSKLSPRDKEFLPQITSVVRHVIRQVDERIKTSDLVELCLVNLPLVIKQHYSDFRLAKSKLGTSHAAASPSDLADVFHRIQPHIAIRLPDGDGAGEPEKLLDPVYLGAAVDLILKACLPPVELQSEMEKNMLREIIVGPVLGTVFERLTQPWFIHTALLNVLGSPNVAPTTVASEKRSSNLTFHSLALIFFTTVQTISAFFIQAINLSQSTVALASSIRLSERPGSTPITTRKEALQELFSSQPASLGRQGLSKPSLNMIREVLNFPRHASSSPVAAASLDSTEAIATIAEPFLDRLLPYLINTKVLTAKMMLTIVESATKNLFPDSNNGYPGPPPEVPSPAEQILLREKLQTRLRELAPELLITSATLGQVLDPLSSPECNAHLIISILDLILVTLFPEFAA